MTVFTSRVLQSYFLTRLFVFMQMSSTFTLSTIHKIGFDLASSKLKRDSTDPRIRIGPNLFYYFASDPLGKFSKDEKRFQTGNSWAWSIDIKIEMH